ncbi:hypothetical protein [Anaerobranca gottschalkii]|uniref:Uncharacterized protein n=1 Tax=Anaerobranca gottschalkii DSM 13577 TaxID=1120990 RepID=A0A1I0C830_9FIRM|nr:hypothetical protein [Anaerobranca gottschalkii]SET15103.1 hypothetical protein SAMN03080614_10613 [Anaerobranca gottschalkii DSM 13577]
MKNSFIFLTILVVTIILFIPNGFVFANQSNISSDTIITEENIKDVLTYLGLKEDSLIENDSFTDDGSYITVKQLEKALEEFKKIPKEINIIEELYIDNIINSDDNLKIISSPFYGTATVHRFSTLGSISYHYSASAQYYSNPYRVKYWTGEAYSSNIQVSNNVVGFTSSVTQVRQQTLSVINPGNTNSILKLTADYTFTTWFDVKFARVKIGDTPVNSIINWNNSYIPNNNDPIPPVTPVSISLY